MLAAWTLWQREVVRFFRQRSRIIGALATPVVFWLMMGSGFRGSFSAGGGSYLEYLFPGTVIMILQFTAIFSTISIIEDRREGFLQGVLVAPVSRASIVLGKTAGGTTLALIQALLFTALGVVVGLRPHAAGVAAAVAVMAVVAFGMTALGVSLAWRFNSVQGFHAVMNLFLMPMWVLSGAVFPASGAAGWLKPVMALNPLTYGVSALRGAFAGEWRLPDAGIAAAFSAAMFVAAVIVAGRRDPR